MSEQKPRTAEPSSVPSVRDVDAIYRESDRLYYGVARDCGLSIASFWALVTIVINGGATTQAAIANEYFYSRQTVNSAVKNLEAKGLVAIACEGDDRRRKQVSLTPAGQAFCVEHICPAIDAEQRAFETLSVEERKEFVRLVRSYTDAMDDELGKITAGRKQPPADPEKGPSLSTGRQ